VFAAIFFVAFGLSIDVGAIGPVVVPVLIAITITVLTNVSAGLITCGRRRSAPPARTWTRIQITETVLLRRPDPDRQPAGSADRT
jgi:Kef-type K+ transport system membrane component KefB